MAWSSRTTPVLDLAARYVGRLEPFRALDAFELYRFAFVERAVAVLLDGGVVHENILAG